MPRRASTKPRSASPARRSPAVVVLGVDCTLRQAVPLKTLLLDADASSAIILDGRAVQRIDAAGLQLLAALAVRESAAGRPLQWNAASRELRAACARAGLTAVLALDGLGEAA